MRNAIFFIIALFITFSCSNDNEDNAEYFDLIISAETTTCHIINDYECYLVKYTKDDEWQPFSESIRGFDYEKGYEYVIVVKAEKRKEVLQDQIDTEYSLHKLISRTKLD